MSFDDIDPRDVSVRQDVLPDLARAMARQLAEDLRTPSGRAGFGTTMVTTLLLARMRMPALAAISLGVMAGLTAEKLYVMFEDVHDTALAQRAYLERLTDEAGEV